MIKWETHHRWARYVNGQLVVLSRSKAGMGTYTDAITADDHRLSVAHLTDWANQEFAGIPIQELACEDGLIGITIATYN